MHKLLKLLKNPRVQKILISLAPLVISAITRRMSKGSKGAKTYKNR